MQKTTQKRNHYFTFLFFILLSCSTFSVNAQILNANSTQYTVPSGVYAIEVEAWGAGGNGGTITSNNTRGAGGGGGGAYSKATIDVYPGEIINYEVGKSSASNRDSMFKDSETVLAIGGGNVGNSTSGAAGGSKSASVGNTTIAGSYGANGGNNTAGGKGGNSPSGGTGGNGAGTSSSNYAQIGGNPGGGGGGGYKKKNGGNNPGASGGNGQIKITTLAGSPEIDVFGILIPIASGSIEPLFTNGTDFGSCATDYTQGIIGKFVIKNTGNRQLYISDVSIGSVGFGATPPFTIVSPNFPTTVAAGGQITLNIKFSPTLPGIYNAEVKIKNTDANEQNYTFKIKGHGKRTFLDSDGDGITDNIDIDDDNDGITDLKEQEQCLKSTTSILSTYTFLNETFGQGPTKGRINVNIPGATTGYIYQDGGASGTETLEDGRYVVTHRITTNPFVNNHPQNIHGDQAWYDGEDHTGDEHGRMAVFNADINPGVFYETTIAGVIPNVPTTYSFWALNIMRKNNFEGSRLPKIKVQFVNAANNIVVHQFSTGDIARCTDGYNNCEQGQWIQFSTEVNLGSVTNFIIRFRNEAAGGGGNDLALDDIVITQKYCDSDADGIPDIYDLDSDNDGISDAEEAGFYDKTSGHSFISSANTTTWKDVAPKNGMHDAIDALIASGQYNTSYLFDTDGDGVPDFLDLDSDNDSIFDIDEAGLLNGDGDIDGDGTGDGIDSDSDGILDKFDNFVGFGTVDRMAAQNSSGNGMPDYRSVASIDGIMDISTTLYASLDTNGDGKIDGTADFDKDGILDAFDTATTVFGSPRDLNRKLYLEFDGRNDYAQSIPLLGGLSKATMMGWIKIPTNTGNSGIIMGQENFNITINNGVVSTNVGNKNASTGQLDPNRWYHIAATFDGNVDADQRIKLYINGNGPITAESDLTTLGASSSKFTLGSDTDGISNFYKGALDEVRVFNIALSRTSISRMVYQEIKLQDSNSIRGEVIPLNIGGYWSNLIAYYRMDTYKNDILDDYKTTDFDQGTNPDFMRIYNVKNIRVQQAPMPFETKFEGSLAETVSQNNDVFGMDVMNTSSILRMNHNITLTGNMTNLGLLVKDNITYTVDNNSQIRNNWYLKLDGLIKLKGQSQLYQSTSSELDPTSSGWIERDQQGTVNKFNYNYWSSPVGPRQAISNNTDYTVAGIMKDGTSSTPQNIVWTSGYDGSPTSPITLSSYWIFKFQNLSDAYANWGSVGPNGLLKAGQGFTLKGSGVADVSATQNYTFKGKPFNGEITMPVAANNLNLSGNPYASALDSERFINDNLTSTTGTLLFWEHAPSNSTHVTAQYQGGYSSLNLSGGTPPIAPTNVANLGNSSRIPKRYVPVGQGFFVTGSETGGNITFKNSQRVFAKETHSLSNSLFKDSAAPAKSILFDNSEDTAEEDTFTRLRIGFVTATNFHRQLLLAYMEENADDAINKGYDAEVIDIAEDDMYFIQDSITLNIQGVGYYNPSAIYPLGVKITTPGIVKFNLDEATYLQTNSNVYLYDKLQNHYFDLQQVQPEIEMQAGTHDSRFSLRFRIPSFQEHYIDDLETLSVFYTAKNTSINVRNSGSKSDVKRVYLYNMLGQQIRSFETKGLDQENMIFDTEILATGTYIIKVEGAEKTVSKKMTVQ